MTTLPEPAASASIRPRASISGAKKLTWNTCCQTSSVVPMEESRSIHFSVRAGSAVTVAGGGFICDRNERIICGL